MKKLLLLLLLTSCSMSEVMEIEEPRMQADTTEYTPMEKGKRPHDHDKKVPISFDVDVDNWGDEEEIPVDGNPMRCVDIVDGVPLWTIVKE